MTRQKKPEPIRNEDGVKLKKDGEVDKRSENGLKLVKDGTFLQKKVSEAVQESKKLPDINDEDESDSSDEETEFEITNLAEKKEIDEVIEEKVTKKLEFVRDTEEKTKKFLEQERLLQAEKELIKKEKEDLLKERDELRRSLEPVHKDFQTLLNENRQLKKLRQQNDHLDKLAKMTRKYIQL
jgi:hypothetical protein